MNSIITALDRQFLRLHDRSLAFLKQVPDDILYTRSSEKGDPIIKLTIGENILRSAAHVELTFGGITTRLWDDPFEWTLPEALSNTAKIAEYLGEVETTRRHGFTFFKSDDDLSRTIPAPRDILPIGEILLETLGKAEHYQGRAIGIFQTISGIKLPVR